MKKLNKLSVLALTSLFILSSCENTELDLTSNPNALSPDNASVDLFINNVQEDFANFVNSMGDVGARLTRIAQMSGEGCIKMHTLLVHSQVFGQVLTKV